jgi:hypothetical protein
MKLMYYCRFFSVQHIVFGLTGLVAVFIPDIPSKVKIQIQRENQLDREAFFEMEFQQAKAKKETSVNPEVIYT